MPAESTACPSVQIIGIDEIPALLTPAPAFAGTSSSGNPVVFDLGPRFRGDERITSRLSSSGSNTSGTGVPGMQFASTQWSDPEYCGIFPT
jgi:hypothetical protein